MAGKAPQPIVHGYKRPLEISGKHSTSYVSRLSNLYHRTLQAGEYAAHYWTDVSAHSKSRFAQFAAIPGVLASVWTPEAMDRMSKLYKQSTEAGSYAAQHWADIATNSKHPLAPLANVPGLFAALWTPETAPTTAITLGSAVYGFCGVPQELTHFTTSAGAAGIAREAAINASKGSFFGVPRLGGLFGPGVYMARIGRPINFFIRAESKIPIVVNTPAGTARIVPYIVYLRWGTAPLRLP